MTPAHLLHLAAGRPHPRKPVINEPTQCYWCGIACEEYCAVKVVLGDTFTDYASARRPHSAGMCVPCAWTMTGRPPDTLRMWSVVYREDGAVFAPRHAVAPDLGPKIALCNKADTSDIVRVLVGPPDGPWICSVADSGQIHVVPHAVVNHGNGPWRVRFERTTVASSPAEFRRVLGAALDLYEAGYAKEEIASGDPSPSKLAKFGPSSWRAGNAVLHPYRGGTTLDLALFLMRKDVDYGMDRTRPEPGGRDLRPGSSIRAGHDGEREHGQDPAAGLVVASEERARDGGRRRGDVRSSREQGRGETPDRGSPGAVVQLNLFDL